MAELSAYDDDAGLTPGRSDDSTTDTVSEGAGATADITSAGDAATIAELVCPQGSSSAPVAVTFACDQITVLTCKDLSNVVIELSDGSRERIEGRRGRRNSFVVPGREITRVWVKAGNNHSGEGPGYGERFDAPSGSCTTPPNTECAALVDATCIRQNPPTPPPPDPEAPITAF